jgi:hypothetical protein
MFIKMFQKAIKKGTVSCPFYVYIAEMIVATN